MITTLSKILTLGLVFTGIASAGANYPSLLDVKIGQPFGHPNNSKPLDHQRPTTQFRVPNYGKSKTLFPEYQVVSLNSTNIVAIVTAEAAMATVDECWENRPKVNSWIYGDNENIKPAQNDGSNLDKEKGVFDKNIYYTVECTQSYGPFWTLRLLIRGKEEDRQLKEAWEKFFNK